jgi:hypothetical protein
LAILFFCCMQTKVTPCTQEPCPLADRTHSVCLANQLGDLTVMPGKMMYLNQAT